MVKPPMTLALALLLAPACAGTRVAPPDEARAAPASPRAGPGAELLEVVRGVLRWRGPAMPGAPRVPLLDPCSVARLAGRPVADVERYLASDPLGPQPALARATSGRACAAAPYPEARMAGDWQVDSLRAAGPYDTRGSRPGLVVLFTTFATPSSMHFEEYVLRPSSPGNWAVIEQRIRPGSSWSPVMPETEGR